MSEFKIEYDPDYSTFNYRVYRKEYSWFKFVYSWKQMGYFDTLEKAETALRELIKYPKFYSGDAVEGIYNKE